MNTQLQLLISDMPRKSTKPPKPKALFSRSETIGLCKRFVKPEQYDGARDLMVMYKLFKQFPNREFWLNYTLDFQLNATLWFLGEDGQTQLNRDWSIFHLDLSKQTEYKLEDKKVGEDIPLPPKPKTLAEFLQ